jgi:tRNA G18 (ribose-2'-O)-methylase SpoU
MEFRLLASRDNPVLKSFRRAAARPRGTPEEIVVAEGTRVIEEALRTASDVQVLLVSEGFGQTSRESALLEQCVRARTRIYRSSPSKRH